VDGCSITASYARLDFHMNEPLDKEALTAGIARAGGRRAPGAPPLDQRSRARRQPGLVRSMSVQPPRGSGRVRVLEIAGRRPAALRRHPCGQHRRDRRGGGHEDREEERR
jgi:misacylated tRNA(Ala) deacylase